MEENSGFLITGFLFLITASKYNLHLQKYNKCCVIWICLKLDIDIILHTSIDLTVLTQLWRSILSWNPRVGSRKYCQFPLHFPASGCPHVISQGPSSTKISILSSQLQWEGGSRKVLFHWWKMQVLFRQP